MKATIEFGYHRVIVPFQADQTVSQLMTQELAPREYKSHEHSASQIQTACKA